MRHWAVVSQWMWSSVTTALKQSSYILSPHQRPLPIVTNIVLCFSQHVPGEILNACGRKPLRRSPWPPSSGGCTRLMVMLTQEGTAAGMSLPRCGNEMTALHLGVFSHSPPFGVKAGTVPWGSLLVRPMSELGGRSCGPATSHLTELPAAALLYGALTWFFAPANTCQNYPRCSQTPHPQKLEDSKCVLFLATKFWCNLLGSSGYLR